MPRSSGTKSKKRTPKLTPDELREMKVRAAVCETERIKHAMLVQSFKTYTASLKERYGMPETARVNPETGEITNG